MSLLRSFAHNVVLHPLLFVRDVAEQAGFNGVAVLLSRLHDRHEMGELSGLVESRDSTDDGDVPPQDPWTPEAAEMVYRPPAPRPHPERPPLAGSLAARRGRARGNIN